MPTRYTPNETTRNMIDRVLQSLKSARWNVGVTMNIDYIQEELSRNEENYMNEVSQLKNIDPPKAWNYMTRELDGNYWNVEGTHGRKQYNNISN